RAARIPSASARSSGRRAEPSWRRGRDEGRPTPGSGGAPQPLPRPGPGGGQMTRRGRGGETKVAHLQDRRALRSPSPDQCPNAGKKLGEGEGFRQVVVGRDIQTPRA